LWITTSLIVGGILIFLSASLALLLKSSGMFGSAVVSQVVLGLCGGAVALYTMLNVPTKLLRKYAGYIFGVSVFLTFCVFLPVIGVSINGARRWVDLGFITFQPSELIKIGYILYLGAFLANGKNRGADVWGGIVPFVVLTGVVGIALLVQPDTDTFLVIAASGAAMMFAAGTSYRDIGVALLVAIIGLGGLIMLRPYLLDRVQTFLDPGRDPLGSGYQIQQSLIAVGSGEVWGRGYGQSIQKFNYLPEASSDSVFAVFAEEFGFVGSVLLVFGFLSFALRGMWVAARAHDAYGGLVALGIVTLIASQAFLNIAAMTGIAPVGGLPLPFVSHGGTALMIALLMVGIVLNISRTTTVV
jgi:cell division protein FtsW